MERKDLLCALFFLLSVMMYLSYARGQTTEVRQQTTDSGNDKGDHRSIFITKQYLLAFGFFVLALMSKPMAVSLPVVLLILDWYPLNRIESRKGVGKVLLEKIPFVALSLASSVITIAAQSSGAAISSLDVVPLSTRLLVAASSLVTYIGKMLLPLDLLPFYPYPKDVSLLSPEHLPAIGLVLGITAACVVIARKQKLWLSAWGYYVVTLIPVLGIVQVGGQSMADRYTYLPSLAPFLIAGSMVAWLSAKARESIELADYRFFAIAVLILGVPLSYLTVQQIRVWHDSVSLWDHVLEKEPEVNIARVNRGIAYLKRGQLDKALEDLNWAIASRRDHKAFYNRGLLFTKLNLLPQAIADYSSAIALNPSFYEAYNNRGALFEKQGHDDKAVADYNAAISLRPSYFQAYMNRGLVFERAGQYDRALADFDRAIALNPGHPDAYYNRGLFLFNRLGKLDGALADLDRAIALNPGDPDAYFHRGLLFDRMGQLDRAIADFDKTIFLNPSYYKVYYSRSLALRKTGQLERADRDLTIWKEHSTKP